MQHLEPISSNRECEWIRGFISEEVFEYVRELLEYGYEREIRSAADADSLLGSGAKPVRRMY